MGTKYKRKRLWVDAFQSSLMLRMSVYLLLYAVVVWHIGFLFHLLVSLTGKGMPGGFGAVYLDFLTAQRPLLYALVVTGPALLYDMLKFSNRVAGPLFRCRRMMDDMAAGKQVPEFYPRKNDFMGEFFQSFNRLIRAWNARAGAGANGQAAPPTQEQVPTNGESSHPEKVLAAKL